MLNALPKSAQPGARKALRDIYNAEDRERAVKAVAAFDKTYGVKWPKAARKITDDVGRTAGVLRLPRRARVHLRTTNAIESTLATVRLRTKVTKGAGSAAAALAMVFELVESAQHGGERSTHPTSSRLSGPEPASSAATS